jgi:CheY-like chemotaxis protein
MDHMMPEMDGIETVKHIRALGYTRPIAALTANALVGNEKFFAENGFDDYISKPIDVRNLDRVLCRFVRDMNPEKAELYKNTNRKLSTPTIVNPKLIELFLRDAKKALETLSGQNRRKSDLEKITTAAHGVKSACANVGESAASENARLLEAAARAKDIDETERLLGAFIRELSEVIARKEREYEELKQMSIQQSQDKQDTITAPKTPDDPAHIAETFRSLKYACEDYDDQTAEQIIKKLAGMSLSESERKLVEDVSDLLFHADFESAAGLL